MQPYSLCMIAVYSSQGKCVKCRKKVGPGCNCEKCLHQRYNYMFGLCKECYRIGRTEVLTKSTPDYRDILTVAAGLELVVVAITEACHKFVSKANMPVYPVPLSLLALGTQAFLQRCHKTCHQAHQGTQASALINIGRFETHPSSSGY